MMTFERVAAGAMVAIVIIGAVGITYAVGRKNPWDLAPACVDSVRIISERTTMTEHRCGPGQTLTVYPAKDEMAVVAICRCGTDAGSGEGVEL